MQAPRNATIMLKKEEEDEEEEDNSDSDEVITEVLWRIHRNAFDKVMNEDPGNHDAVER